MIPLPSLPLTLRPSTSSKLILSKTDLLDMRNKIQNVFLTKYQNQKYSNFQVCENVLL